MVSLKKRMRNQPADNFSKVSKNSSANSRPRVRPAAGIRARAYEPAARLNRDTTVRAQGTILRWVTLDRKIKQRLCGNSELDRATTAIDQCSGCHHATTQFFNHPHGLAR